MHKGKEPDHANLSNVAAPSTGGDVCMGDQPEETGAARIEGEGANKAAAMDDEPVADDFGFAAQETQETVIEAFEKVLEEDSEEAFKENSEEEFEEAAEEAFKENSEEEFEAPEAFEAAEEAVDEEETLIEETLFYTRDAKPRKAEKQRKSGEKKGNKKTRKGKKGRSRDYGETNLLIIRLLVAGGFILLAVLVILSISINREGKEAESYANQLLEAYQAQPSPTLAPAEAPSPTPSAAPEGTTEPSAAPSGSAEPTEAPTPTPEPVAETNEAEDAAGMRTANEHRLEDDSGNVDEAADYQQPEEPEVDEAEQIIANIVNRVGEDGIIGIIEIPEIEVELPVIGKWSYALLKISVCRYKGPGMNKKGNLVVMGHNYKSGAHFGNLSELSVGSAVYLTDEDSNKVRYEVYDMDTIAPDAFSALNSYKGTAGLTLMTCRNSGNNRLLVRCVQKEAEIPQAR